MRTKYQSTLLVTTLLFLLSGFVVANVPSTLSYQGCLTDGSGDPVANGSYSIVFTIYDAPVNGDSKWTETQDVDITDCSFTVLLGSDNPIFDSVFNGASRFLGIAISGDPEITPRTALVSVPYSMKTSTIEGATGGIIYGPLEVVVADLDSIGNALVVSDTLGQIQLTITASAEGLAVIDFYDPVDSKKSLATLSDPKVRISKDGVTMFGATISDTTFLAFPNGDIISRGKIAVGANAAGSGVGATVFGINNSAEDSSCAIGGGSYNTAGGVHSTIAGGNHNAASAIYSSIGGGTDNTASGLSSTIAGGRYLAAIGRGSFIGGGIFDTANGDYTTIGGGKYNFAGGEHSVIGGGYGNRTLGNEATICGGYNNSAEIHSYVGGGFTNLATGILATIGGGQLNSATGSFATIGGGDQCIASGEYSIVAGGASNTAKGNSSFVGGGWFDSANGYYATVPGGSHNNADGDYSFAAGRRAHADHEGSFVWADGTDADYNSLRDNQFAVRANGGVRVDINTSDWLEFYDDGSDVITSSTGAHLTNTGIWVDNSDRNSKENLREIDHTDLLEKLSQLPITNWNYIKDSDEIRHAGPMAQDFYAAFGLGNDNKSIATLDESGIALAAIQALYKQLQELKSENATLKAKLAATDDKLGELIDLVHTMLEKRNKIGSGDLTINQ